MNSSVFNTLTVYCANYLYIVLLFVALVWLLLQPRASKLEMVAWGLVALPVLYVLLIIAGMAYFDPRPFDIGHYTPLIPHSPDNGFPSDHTLLCSATSSIVLFYSKKTSVVLWLMTVLVGASRVYAGVHHTTDIVASMVLAASVSALVWYLVLPAIKRTTAFDYAMALVS